MLDRVGLTFTFHNVSINTVSATEGNERHEDLHSTMFLLILKNITTDQVVWNMIYIPQCFY